MSSRLNLNRLAHFVAIIDAGTITGAAAALGISKAVVSKQLQLLEDDVGRPLMLRNTRHLQPTAAGQAFYEEAKSILMQAENAYLRVQDKDSTPKGRLRITAPVDFGTTDVAPLIARFQADFPQVVCDLILSDDILDMVEQRIDLAFRIGWLSDSSNLARKLLDFEAIAVCSPETARDWQISAPEMLVDKPFVNSTAIAPGTTWQFRKGTDVQALTPHHTAQINNSLAMVAYVKSGPTFTILPDYLLRRDLQTQRLVHLLPDWTIRAGGIFTVTPPNRVRSTALHRFLEQANRELKTERRDRSSKARS